MNRDVYSFLLKTYGREPGYWAGFVLIIIQTLLLRVVAFLFIAHLASSLAAGNIDAAKRDILLYLATTILGLSTCIFNNMN